MRNKAVSLLSVPFGLGGARQGAELGPKVLIEAGIVRHLTNLNIQVINEGEVILPPVAAASELTAIDTSTKQFVSASTNLKYLNEIIMLNTVAADRVSNIVEQGHFPLILGGDHSISIGTIAGIRRHYRNLGVIWFDAHGDLNTEATSPTGNIHGMSLAVNLGQGHPLLTQIHQSAYPIDPSKVVIIGARSLDQGEREYIRSFGVTCFTMHDIDRKGMLRVMEEALAIVGSGTDGVHLSFDIDSLDPYEAPGTGTPVQGGVNYREAHLALELMHESGLITSAEFVEVNPTLDQNKRTVLLANGLICSLLGQTIL
ncbi:arginase [Paenibacillus arenosi]|uniref:Arginase n=1 Tax=Paenibacillus arenosi TaxID=2774142 RepID=A0ABR9B3L9_9BACL|nr:arginase [Paenibacillus arenosi]MBD8500940.1 arginase [Paenibacillus arenosi]